MSSKTLRTIGTSRPIRMWIDGKCFDVKQSKNKSSKMTSSTISEPKDEGESSVEVSEDDSNSRSISLVEIVKDENGKISTSFELPAIYYIRMNQSSVLDVTALSNQTNTEIIIPKYGKEGKLVITGNDEENVKKAVAEIHCVVGNLRDQAPPMQFIAIPLLSDEIQGNFEKFKAAVLSEKDIKDIEESIFQKSKKLHLTVLVCVLHNIREKNEAIAALKDYKDHILRPLIEKNGPITIHVSGVECMTEDYKKANVIYANAKIIEESGEFNLQKIVNDLSDFFYGRGLLKRYQENVKLHMTVINTKYRKIPESPRRYNKRQSIDATKIIEKYKDYDFGTCKLDNIRLSVMSTEGVDGFYNSLSVIEV